MFCCLSVKAASPVTNTIIALSTNSLNSTQFNTTGLPLTITNIDGSLISGNIIGTNITGINATNITNGTLQNSVISGADGNGLTNVWIRTLIPFGNHNFVISSPTTTYYLPWGTAGGNAAVLHGTALLPIGGYLSNMTVWSSVAWPSTTNAVYTVQTNIGLSVPVSTPLTLTLAPAGGSTYTNSGTTSYILPTAQNASGYVFTIQTSYNSSLAGGQDISGFIEWWHPNP